jgi:hypothetical protein
MGQGNEICDGGARSQVFVDDLTLRNTEKSNTAPCVGRGIEGRKRRGQPIRRQGENGVIGRRSTSVGGASDMVEAELKLLVVCRQQKGSE